MSETVQPKKVRFITRGFVYRQFTWRERLSILLGYSVLLEIHLATEHNPGQSQPVTVFHITSSTNEADALIKVRKEALAEHAALVKSQEEEKK